MITHILKSPQDEAEINRSCSKIIVNNEQPKTYKGIVVPKPWGEEFLFFEDQSIAAWFLSIGKNHSTSMHCHPNKRTVLIILSGIALGRTLNGSSVINTGEIVIYEPGVFHSTKGITNIEMAEIESPVLKTDLLRLHDQYGREQMGYEGKQTMVNSHNYFYLEDSNPIFTGSGYIINKGNQIKSGQINVIGDNISDIVANSCILETKDSVIQGSSILRFKFPSRERLYECRKCI